MCAQLETLYICRVADWNVNPVSKFQVHLLRNWVWLIVCGMCSLRKPLLAWLHIVSLWVVFSAEEDQHVRVVRFEVWWQVCTGSCTLLYPGFVVRCLTSELSTINSHVCTFKVYFKKRKKAFITLMPFYFDWCVRLRSLAVLMHILLPTLFNFLVLVR